MSVGTVCELSYRYDNPVYVAFNPRPYVLYIYIDSLSSKIDIDSSILKSLLNLEIKCLMK